MSRIVDENDYEWSRGGGKEEIYPYDEWTDGKARILVRGVDFESHLTPEGLRNTFRRALEKRGYRLRIKILNDDEVAVQALWR